MAKPKYDEAAESALPSKEAAEQMLENTRKGSKRQPHRPLTKDELKAKGLDLDKPAKRADPPKRYAKGGMIDGCAKRGHTKGRVM